MKTKLSIALLFVFTLFFAQNIKAEDEERNVQTFSEVSLRIPAKLHLEQGAQQSVEIVAESSVLNDIITEVKNRKLIIRFPGKNYLKRSYKPGKIEIFITVPEIDAIGISGSGDIFTEEIKSRIIDLSVSGSGGIEIDALDAERVKVNISGSGNIKIKDGGVADEFTANLAGSGNVKAADFEAKDVDVKIAGSGNCTIHTEGSIKARLAGSGNVYYKGNPSIDSSVAGSGKVQKL